MKVGIKILDDVSSIVRGENEMVFARGKKSISVRSTFQL
jgi:WD40 repeat protein